MLGNLPFINIRRKQKIKNSVRAIKLIYNMAPKTTIFEALFFFADAFLVMYRIKVFGIFLDETVKYVSSRAEFSFDTYITSSSFKYFLFLFLVWAVINLFSSINKYLKRRLRTIFNYQVFPNSIIEKISSLNMGDVESTEFQDLFWNVNAYSRSRIWDTYILFRQVVHSLIMVFSAFYFVAEIHPLLPLGAIFPVIPEIYYKYVKRIKKRNFLAGVVEKNKFINHLYRQVTQLRNFPELKVSDAFDFLYKSRDKVATELSAGVLRNDFDRYVKGFSFAFIDQAFFRLALILLVAFTIVQNLTVGTFQAIFNYMVNLYDSSLYFFERLSMIGANATYICDYYDFLEFEGFGDISSGTERLDSRITSIELENLTFTYSGREEPTLNNVNFSISAGEKVALVGPDGSGVTTLLRLLCGLYKVTDGDIYYNGVSIRSLARGELKDKVSAVFEDDVRYNMSIRKSITIADLDRDFDRELYKEVLRVTLLDRWMAREGIKDSQILGRVQRKGMGVSAAHRQRISLARCLYRNRSVFLMDEPLSLVDTVKRRQIFRSMLDFVGERILIVTLNGLEDVSFFDRVFRVDGGEVTESGFEDRGTI